MWFLFDDGRFWFHTPDIGQSPFLRAARSNELVSVMVDTFDPTGDIKKVRASGPADAADADHHRVTQLYDRYLGPASLWNDDWRRQVTDPGYVLWSTEPSTGNAVQYPMLEDARPIYRWTDAAEFHEAAASFRDRR